MNQGYYICNNSFIGLVVHHKDCSFLVNNQKKFLGTFHNYPQAVAIAKQRYSETDQCQACLNLQHKNTASPTTKLTNKILNSGSEFRACQSENTASDLKQKGLLILTASLESAHSQFQDQN